MRFVLGLALFFGTIAVAAIPQGRGGAPPQVPPATNTPQVDGSAVFKQACASCHQPGQTGTPTPEALRAFSPEAIVNALTNGKMSLQGAALSAGERTAVAQFIAGRSAAAATAGISSSRCSSPAPTSDPARGPGWTAWGNDAANSRYAPNGGLTAADLPRL
jgi:polyvinyl alcohol dehydrogenase (cytochrome)